MVKRFCMAVSTAYLSVSTDFNGPTNFTTIMPVESEVRRYKIPRAWAELVACFVFAKKLRPTLSNAFTH